MKIAVCLFGHLRTYEHCWENLRKHLIDLYDCDVFMHTWSTLERKTASFYEVTMDCNACSSCNKSDLTKKYNLKDLQIDIQEDREEEFGYFNKKRSIWGLHCMLKSMKSAFEMSDNYAKNNNIEYDYILFTRPDILFNMQYKIENYIRFLNDDEIDNSLFCSIPRIGVRVNDDRIIGGCDLVFFATQNVVKNFIN